MAGMIAEAIGQAVLGWIAADLIGGALHWMQDRVATPRWPLVGHLVTPSRLHHVRPLAFMSGGFVHRNWASAMFAVLIGAAWLAAFGPSIALAFAVAGGAISAQVHYWAHRPKRTPALVVMLQEVGALQSPGHHGGHHKPPQNRRYCVLTNWCNPVLDRLQLWARLERLRPA